MIVWHEEPFMKMVSEASGKKLRLLAMLVHRKMITSFSPNAPSLPGNPPAVRTGNLRSSIVWEMNKDETVARIGVPKHAIYGLYLELGSKFVKPRPWMKPAVEAVMNEQR